MDKHRETRDISQTTKGGNPLVSVVMPAYNAGRFIEKAIRSIESQTVDSWELIVVDDCSEDKTRDIVRGLQKEDQRIALVECGENRGVSHARNTGVALGKGRYIALLDSDDYWRATKLEKQLELLEEYPDCSLCYTGSAFVDRAGNRLQYTLDVPESLSYLDLLRQNLISCSSVLVKREALLRHPMEEKDGIHEDYASWLGILKDEPLAVGINEPLLVYRVNPDSKSGNKLKASRMQWNTYKHVGLRTTEAMSCFCSYATRSLKKYRPMWTALSRRDG